MMYTVSVYSASHKQWIRLGRYFRERAQAVEFLHRLPTSDKRLEERDSDLRFKRRHVRLAS